MAKVISDEQILKAVVKEPNAEKLMKKLGIKSLGTLQNRIARIQYEKQQFIYVEGLYPKRNGGRKKAIKIQKNGGLSISPAWMKDSNFKIGDTFDVKFTKDKITLIKKK